MGWVFENACESFDQHREMWDEINRSQTNHILLDSAFVRLLIHYFAGGKTLLGISKDRRNPGVVLVQKVGKGSWQTFQPSQAPIGLLLLGNKALAMKQTQELFHALPGLVVSFAVLQQDPDCTVFAGIGQSDEVEVSEYIKTARLTLQGSFEEYWKTRGKDLVDNLARRCRHLAKQGIAFELVVDRDPSCVAQCVRQYGELEATGWKVSQGTAVSVDNVQGQFYQEMLEHFCERGEGVIFRLLFNGRIVASQLGLERNGVIILLKTAFDERFKRFAPGFLLQREIFKTLFSQGNMKVVEFYGRVREGWTRKWSDEIRTMYHLTFFRYGSVAIARRLLKGIWGSLRRRVAS